MSDKPKKKITWKQWQRRTMLIILAVVAVFVALYFAVYRQPQPLMEMDCMVGTDAPAAGTITQYSQDNLEGVVFTVSGEEDVADLWQAMQSTQVRLLRGRSVPAPPVGGYYYEVSLTSADGGSTYSFGCDSSGELLILGGGYAIHGESNLLPALDALFADGAPHSASPPGTPGGEAFPVGARPEKNREKPRKNFKKTIDFFGGGKYNVAVNVCVMLTL